MNFFKKKRFFIVEEIVGNWHYHISTTNENCKPALCGNKNVMKSNLSLSGWGTHTHLNEKYCKECEIQLRLQKT